ncbi:MAG: S8 family serine peptidase, partial [Bacteroidales bacterium]|nr:S8 family serine peptidase [Bacteroidales bacterium]
MALLQDEAGNDKVVDIKAHWIVNTINCSATRDVIYKLSEQPGISVIGLNDKVKLLSNEKPTRVSQSKSIIDNVTTVGADDVWAAGYTGKDVTVALLDSGVNSEHVDLADHLWDGGDEYPDHGWNFIDNNSNTNDYDGHGTHCAGTICGDGTSGIQTGMAPDATLMCLKVLDDEGYGTLEALVSGVEFAVEHGADIMSISLGWVNPNTYVSIIMREMFENVLATGVVAAVAAGNERAGIDTIPIPRNINAPGNCPPPWLHPDQQYNPGGLSAVVSVGAVDYSDDVAYFSSRGPVTWQGTEWDDYKYDFRYNDNINVEDGWIYYDNGFGTDGVGGPDYFQWGIMIPASKLQQYESSYMTKVAIYDLVADNPQLLIYYGGDYAPETLVYVQDCELSGSNSMLEIELDEALPIYNENIWVVMYTQNGASYPAACCDNTGDP